MLLCAVVALHAAGIGYGLLRLYRTGKAADQQVIIGSLGRLATITLLCLLVVAGQQTELWHMPAGLNAGLVALVGVVWVSFLRAGPCGILKRPGWYSDAWTAVGICRIRAAFMIIELVQRHFGIPKELTRKVAHIIGAGGSAALPLWLAWNYIAILALGFVVIMAVSKRIHGFRSIHEVRRTTYGEIYMPLTVALLALCFPHARLYSSSLLVLALADPAAQYIGTRFGRKRLLGGHKTWLGSLTYLLIALVVLVPFGLLGGDRLPFSAIILAAVSGTVAEAVSSRGTDNLTAPLVIALILRYVP
ncbi:MAG: hypothetical protein WDN27_05290 [Candidatus Saccharibacteria bacterium]